jgi:hypothetical protein
MVAPGEAAIALRVRGNRVFKTAWTAAMSLRTASAVFAYLLLAVVLRFTYGTFHATWVLVLAGGIAAYAGLMAVRNRRLDEPDPCVSVEFVYATVLMTFALMLWIDPMVVYASNTSALNLIRACSVALVTAAGMCFVAHWLSPSTANAFWGMGLFLGTAALLVARFQTLRAVPNPTIDVFITNTLAVDYLRAGLNPYAHTYPDVYDGKYGYAPGFFYWPAYLYEATIARAVFGDIRFAMIAADMVAALLVRWIGKRLGLSPPAAWLVALLWLAQPVSLLVLELAWVDPLMIGGVAVLAWAMLRRYWLLAGAMLGLVAATKQYGILLALPTLAFVFASQRRQTVRVAVAASVTWCAFVLPFVLADWRGFYDHTIGVYLSVPPRNDALSLVAWSQNVLGLTLPQGLAMGVALAIAGGLTWRLSRSEDPTLADWAGVTAVAYAVVFLLGKQAFCNYYFLVAFFVLLHALFSQGNDERRLETWTPSYA